MFVDLHLHTFFSDGKCSPTEVLQKAISEKIDIVSIVDHDTIDGAKQVLNTKDILVIPGIEFTVRSQKYDNVDCGDVGLHILGYGIDFNSAELNQFLYTHKVKRKECIEMLLDELRSRGFDFSYGDIEVQNGRYVQIADIKRMLIKNKVDQEYIIELVDKYSVLLDEVNCSIDRAISIINNAGGIAVWAHPFISYSYGKKRILQEAEVKAILSALMKLGLKGIEVYYKGFDEEQQEYLKKLATSHKLLMSSGSDFHGYDGRDSFYSNFDTNVQRLVRLLTDK